MKLYKWLGFLFQAVTVGLAFAFLLVLTQPQLFNFRHNVVQVLEAPRDTDDTRPSASFAEAVAKAAPAVVNINTRKVITQRPNPLFDDPFFRHFFGDNPETPLRRQETSLGSGVIISPQGYVLTNNHVIAGAEQIQVSLKDGRTADAHVVGTDPESDLAVLRIELPSLPAITLGHSDKLREGDIVLAIGNPFGVGQTVTQGIVSATGRNQLGISTFENFIQTDAAINPGNSGGALIDLSGELIGVNTAIFSRTGGSQGIGFAIPVSLARDVMQQIIEQGRVTRGWLGIEVQELTPQLAESFGLSSQKGVVVAGVLRDGPAEKAGLQPGDVIIAIAERPIHTVRQALDTIAQARPGSTLDVRVMRDGREEDIDATIAERPVQSQPR